MMQALPPNTVKVKPENMCDVCREKDAKYYIPSPYYIHICSTACFEKFIAGYNREIEEFSRKRLAPDETDTIRKEKNDL